MLQLTVQQKDSYENKRLWVFICQMCEWTISPTIILLHERRCIMKPHSGGYERKSCLQMISEVQTIFSFFFHGIFAMTHSINESLPSDSSLRKYKRRWRSNLIYDYDAAAYIIAIYLMIWESGGSFSQKSRQSYQI